RSLTSSAELAHVWLGESALSDLGVEPTLGSQCEEVWRNAVAAELLVPLAALQSELQRQDEELLPELLCRLAHIFKVSELVILRRLFSAASRRLSRSNDGAAQGQRLDRQRRWLSIAAGDAGHEPVTEQTVPSLLR
ncbi:MAG: ImmA/IrrE family metallo-endopeptidase, partial [Aphanocapsa feldmannii 277cI]